jgi:hypothetical protein
MSHARTTAFLLPLIGFLVTSCGDKLNFAQYRIRPALAGDRVRVSQLLSSVAADTSLPASTPAPALRQSFAYYRRPPSDHSAVDLAARADRRGILIDLAGGVGPTPPDFARSERLLDQRLPATFGSRCVKNARLEE